MENAPNNMDDFPAPDYPSLMKYVQKGEGFPGQRIVVLPRAVLAQARQQPLFRGLLPTDIGYFPDAKGHLRERTQGIEQAIFIFCERGAGWCELARTQHAVRSGEMVVIPPGMPHAYGAERSRPWSIYWFHAQGELLGDFLRELKITPVQPVFHLGVCPQFHALFKEVLDTVEHGYSTQQLVGAAQALAHLLAVLARERGRQHQLLDPKQRITWTIDYMKEHLQQPLQLNTLATLAHLSRSRYAALFKQQVGYAPIDYFIRLRMHQACQWLDNVDWSVKTIAARLGYEDPLYFSRVFRSVMGISPREYRLTHKG